MIYRKFNILKKSQVLSITAVKEDNLINFCLNFRVDLD